MKLSYLPSEFQKALPILEKIKAAGFEAYFVGGSVRDALLNRPIHDVDIASSSYQNGRFPRCYLFLKFPNNQARVLD